jgi:uncharacterized protein YdhG (YjbR/CyaY superfamily)
MGVEPEPDVHPDAARNSAVAAARSGRLRMRCASVPVLAVEVISRAGRVATRILASVRSEASTVDEYLASLPDERRDALEAVRQVILENLPEGYEEAMNWGMITYQVPLDVEPETYNGQPLMYAALASQKHHMAVYLTGVYSDVARSTAFKEAYRESGKKLDMGKSCVRFEHIDDLPLDVIGRTIGDLPVEDFIGLVRSQRGS